MSEGSEPAMSVIDNGSTSAEAVVAPPSNPTPEPTPQAKKLRNKELVKAKRREDKTLGKYQSIAIYQGA